MAKAEVAVGPVLIRAPLDAVVRAALPDPHEARKLLSRHPHGPVTVRTLNRSFSLRRLGFASAEIRSILDEVDGGTTLSMKGQARSLHGSANVTLPNTDGLQEIAAALETKARGLAGLAELD